MVKSLLKILLYVGVLVCLPAQANNYLRDPTTPLMGMQEDEASNSDRFGLSLQAVIIDGKNNRAIINGKTCYQGEKCGGYILTSVNRLSVLLLNEETQQIINLPLYSFGMKK